MSDQMITQAIPEVLSHVGTSIGAYGNTLEQASKTINDSVSEIMSNASAAVSELEAIISEAQQSAATLQDMRQRALTMVQAFEARAAAEPDPAIKSRAAADATWQRDDAATLDAQITDLFYAILYAMKARDGFAGANNFMDVFAREPFAELPSYVPYVRNWGTAVTMFANDLTAADETGARDVVKVTSLEVDGERRYGVYRAADRVPNIKGDGTVIEYRNDTGYYFIDPDKHAFGQGDLASPYLGNADSQVETRYNAELAKRFLEGLRQRELDAQLAAANASPAPAPPA
ncbi:MAG: hypothetical protein ACOYNI_02245 [Acidimicrobiia bacterium]